MLHIELQADIPGHARLLVKNWKGGQDVELSIQRNQDNHYFSSQNTWTNEPVWHKMSGLSVEDNKLSGIIGPWLVDSLVQQVSNVRYLITIRDTQAQDHGPVRMIGNILSSAASGDTTREQNIVSEPVSETNNLEADVETSDDLNAEATTETMPPTAETPKEDSETPIVTQISDSSTSGSSKKGVWIGILIALLALVAALAWFFLQKDKEAATSPTNSQAAATPSACTISADTSDEIMFIQACLKTKPDTSALLAVIEQAKQNGKCGIAQRLYANQAQNGNAQVAIAYAKEYEENTKSTCFKADKNTAIYWYEVALDADPQNAEAKKRLEELKK